jgi:hypothetical protein
MRAPVRPSPGLWACDACGYLYESPVAIQGVSHKCTSGRRDLTPRATDG